MKRSIFMIVTIFVFIGCGRSKAPETRKKETTLGSRPAPGTLVPGTTSTYTDGVNYWAGNPFCVYAGALLQPTSPAIDKGTIIQGFHCRVPGPSNGVMMSGAFGGGQEPCQEWYGKAPDVGACEFVPPGTFNGPSGTTK